MTDKNANKYGFNYPTDAQERALVRITLKSGAQVETSPEPLEDARMTASGFQIAVNDHQKDWDPVAKSTSDLFINILEIAAIEVVKV